MVIFLNKVVLIGRLTKEPELKFTPGNGTAVCTFNLAVDRRFSKDGEKEADFIPIVVWGKIAESTANYTAKGSLVGVSGRIQTRSYDAKDGSGKRYVTEVVADEIQFLSKSNGNNNNSSGGSGFDEPDYTPVGDDIPF